MGGKTILKPIHKRFLETVNKENYITKHYYWTGGTVLSEFYLHHRDSQDIDLFIEDREVFLPPIASFMEKFRRQTKAKRLAHETFLGLESFEFEYTDIALKVDFNYYPFLRIDKGKKWKNIEIDSILDIAVNKVHTIYMKPRTRDYIDLFFIMKTQKYSLEYLIKQAKAKFDWHIDPIQLGYKFMLAFKKQDFPKMLIPFNQKEMETFFLKLAKSLEGEIFK
ncbi:MAG: nucleotidyl transferase AbiEii/AbiGii toxin family protein [Candidatus Roizmanbacteria bacterium]|nr:nucleotidyl transferase AbiEii/AbiGii toxin family protein [Candidatus Roizmanbacteria bacterium]